MDVDGWLDEADQIDRVRKLSDPDTRQFRLDKEDEPESSDEDTDSSELSVSESTSSGEAKALRDQKKKGPGKLPEGYKKAMTGDSKEAADDALKRFFSGR